MENELRHDLRSCAETYAEARKIKISTVGRLAAGDWRFFDRIVEGKSFTARTYDEVMRWFAANWPEDIAWPEDIRRPAPTPEQGAV